MDEEIADCWRAERQLQAMKGGRGRTMNLNVLVLPGDGIGTEVTREAVRVLRTWRKNGTTS
jgi:hypothetical protein